MLAIPNITAVTPIDELSARLLRSTIYTTIKFTMILDRNIRKDITEVFER